MASVDNNFSDFIGCLKSSFDQSVVWHHQTDSYAVHKALNKFYDGILGLVGGWVLLSYNKGRGGVLKIWEI